MWPFAKRVDPAPILAQAEDWLTRATTYQKELMAFKENKLKRQGELWSLPSLTPELEGEYQTVGKAVERTARMLVIIDQYLHDLSEYRYQCRSGTSCDKLSALNDVSAHLTEEKIAAVTIATSP